MVSTWHLKEFCKKLHTIRDKKVTVYIAENWDVMGKHHFEDGEHSWHLRIPAGRVLWGLVPFGEGKEPLSKSYEHFQIDSNEQKTGEKQGNLRFTDIFLQCISFLLAFLQQLDRVSHKWIFSKVARSFSDCLSFSLTPSFLHTHASKNMQESISTMASSHRRENQPPPLPAHKTSLQFPAVCAACKKEN